MALIAPNAKRIIVEKCLEDYFLVTADDRKRRSEIIKSCEDHPTRVYIKTTLRAQRISINFIIVEAYIQTLSEEFQSFLRYKYVKAMTNVQISQIMSCSESMLFHWSNIIIDDLSNLLFYGLSENMLFNETLLLNLINVFNRRIHFIEDNEEQCKDWLDQKWYTAIVRQRDRFEILLQYLQDCLRNHLGDKDIYYIIISAKSQNLQDTASILASKCNTSQSCVSRCIQRYKNVAVNLLKALTLKSDLEYEEMDSESSQNEDYPELIEAGLVPLEAY